MHVKRKKLKDEDARVPFVRLVHKTAQGYLESTLTQHLMERFTSPHCYLSQLCLTHLLHSDFATPDRSFSSEDLEADQRVFPFYHRYVTKEWAVHCYQANYKPRELLLRFLNSQCHIDSAYRVEWHERAAYKSDKFSGPNGMLLAARHGLAPIILELRTKGQDPNREHSIWETPLLEAVASERIPSQDARVETVAKLITVGAFVDQRWGGLTSPISLAFELHNIQVLKLLLRHGTDLQIPTMRGFTPLIHSIKSGDKQLMEVLLSYGAGLSKALNLGDSPLAAAIDYERYGAEAYTFANNEDANGYPDCGLSILATLLEKGVDPNEEDEFGFLHLCCLVRCSLDEHEFCPRPLEGRRALEICEMLVASGANVDLAESNSWVGQGKHGRNESPLEYIRRKISLYGTLKLPSGLSSREEFQLYLKVLLHRPEITTKELSMLGLEPQSWEPNDPDSKATDKTQHQWRRVGSSKETKQSRKRIYSDSESIERVRYWFSHSQPDPWFVVRVLKHLHLSNKEDSQDEPRMLPERST